jgi:hypothetical protein
MAIKTRETPELRPAPQLQPGPYWASFEQFRLSGVDGLREDLGPDQIGKLKVKGEEFVIMRGESFNRLYGASLEIDRLNHQLHLIRQAVELVNEARGSHKAIEHLRDLVDQVPELTMHCGPQTELVFDEAERAQPEDYTPGDQEFELDPTRVRPTWTRG